MEQPFEPCELIRLLEDDRRDRGSIRAARAYDLRAPPLAQSRVDLLVLPQQPVDDLVTRDRGRAVTGERFERRALAGTDAARDGDSG